MELKNGQKLENRKKCSNDCFKLKQLKLGEWGKATQMSRAEAEHYKFFEDLMKNEQGN